MYKAYVELIAPFFGRAAFSIECSTNSEAQEIVDEALSRGLCLGEGISLDDGSFVMPGSWLSPANIARAYVTEDIPF